LLATVNRKLLLIAAVVASTFGASSCGPTWVGTWQFDVVVLVNSPGGSESKTLSIPLQLVAGAKNPAAWRVGSCDLELQVVNDVATMTLPAPTCTLAASDSVPFASQISSASFQAGDVFIPATARFELVHGDKPSAPNYTFRSGEDGLAAVLDFRIRPASEPASSSVGNTYSFNSNGKTFGHRVP
jgi:hypothetical protein